MSTPAIRVAAGLMVLATGVRADTLHDALDRLYNFDFPGAHKALDAHVAANPADPIGPAIRASAYLFYELDRLRILQGEFFSDDKKISGDDRLQPDPAVRVKLFEAVDQAQKLAEARLKQKPGDPNSLFAFCLTEGIRTDYTAFVEKKQLRSLSSARKAHNYAVDLLKNDPLYVDAYLTTGITEYLVGSLPFFVRWFIRFENTQGSKAQAVQNLEKVATNGRYLGPFARILLSIIHLREKRPLQSMQLLDGLTRQFPANPLLRNELDKLKKKYPSGGAD